MSKSILICIHAYRKAINGNKENIVLNDRIKSAKQIADFYDSNEYEIKIVFLGGFEVNNKTTGEISKEYADENVPELTQKYDYVIKDKYGSNTVMELKSLNEFAEEYNPESICLVSSKDHAPRIVREAKNILPNKYNVLIHPSNESYTINDVEPFILEGTYPKLIKPLNKIFSVPHEKHSELAEDLNELIESYSND